MKQKLIAYRGEKFTLEWYFDSSGKSNASEYFHQLTEVEKDKIFHLFKLLGDIGKIFNKQKFRDEGGQIYAFKSDQNRLLCFFFHGAKVIITNGFQKKQDKLPPREKERAIKAKEDYIKRNRGGNYYD